MTRRSTTSRSPSLKTELIRRGVSIVMAGDTHDLEYYAEPGAAGHPVTHHFVNGGGGAYLSFGTALAWPAHPPIETWAHYPNRESVAMKIEDHDALVEAAGVVLGAGIRRVALWP